MKRKRGKRRATGGSGGITSHRCDRKRAAEPFQAEDQPIRKRKQEIPNASSDTKSVKRRGHGTKIYNKEKGLKMKQEKPKKELPKKSLDESLPSSSPEQEPANGNCSKGESKEAELVKVKEPPHILPGVPDSENSAEDPAPRDQNSLRNLNYNQQTKMASTDCGNSQEPQDKDDLQEADIANPNNSNNEHHEVYHILSRIQRNGEWIYIGQVYVPAQQHARDVALDTIHRHISNGTFQEAVERLQSQNDIASRSFVSPDPLDWENFNAFSVYYSESDIPGTSCPVPYTEYLYMFVINSNISGPRGLSREQIDSIATRTLQENDGLSSCRICLLTYKQGVQLRSLPCFHEFHMNCIDHWLLINSTCPVCRNPAIVSDISEPGSRGQAAAT